MKTKVHREGLMFKWISKHHEIVVGFKRVLRGKCSICSKMIPTGNTLCDDCFQKEKKISKK